MPARRGGHGRDSMPPKVIAKPDRGVLPVSATARAPKPPAARLKLEIRRLPPGLTLTEFEDQLRVATELGDTFLQVKSLLHLSFYFIKKL